MNVTPVMQTMGPPKFFSSLNRGIPCPYLIYN